MVYSQDMDDLLIMEDHKLKNDNLVKKNREIQTKKGTSIKYENHDIYSWLVSKRISSYMI